MSVYTCIAQDRARLMQVLASFLWPRPIVHCLLELFGAPLWGVALWLGMADGDSSAEDRRDDDGDLSRTSTATGHRKHSSSQTAAQKEERLAAEKLRHVPFFITSSYYACTFLYTSSAYCQYIHAFCVSLLCYYSSFKFINCCMVEVRDMCLRIAYTWLWYMAWNFYLYVSMYVPTMAAHSIVIVHVVLQSYSYGPHRSTHIQVKS